MKINQIENYLLKERRIKRELKNKIENGELDQNLSDELDELLILNSKIEQVERTDKFCNYQFRKKTLEILNEIL